MTSEETWKRAANAALNTMEVTAQLMGEGTWEAQFFYREYRNPDYGEWATNEEGEPITLTLDGAKL